MTIDTSNPRPAGPCPYFAAGRCRYGDRCRLVHDIAGLNATDPVRPIHNGQSNDIKDNTCKLWKQGSCKFGARCRFSHTAPTVLADEETISSAVDEGSTTDIAPQRRRNDNLPTTPPRPRTISTRPCFKWAATGTCFKGNKCIFYHDPSIPGKLEQERREEEDRIRQVGLQRQREEEHARHEAELQRQGEEARARREADLKRQRDEERARRDAELERQREREYARREAERSQRKQELARVDANRKITCEVDNCLVTFEAGLGVHSVVASFDIVRGRITRLPERIQARNLVNFFTSHGINDTTYFLNKAYKNDSAFIMIASSTLALFNALPPLDGVGLEFTPFKTGPGDDEQTEGTPFARTLTLPVVLHSFAPANASDVLRDHLEIRARNHGLRELRRDTSPALGGSTKVRFSIELDSWDHARDLRDALRRQATFSCGSYRVQLINLFLPSKYSYPLFMPRPQYHAQKIQWDELGQRCKEDGCELKVRDFPDGKVRISLFGNDLSSIGPMKVRAEQLARGTTINMWNRRLFSNDIAQKLTEELQGATGALVQVDRRDRCLRAYGASTAIEHARQRLEVYAEELARNEYTRELSSQHIVRFFVEIGYPQLTETYGEEIVTMDLNSSTKKIIVTGDEEIRHRLDKLFDDSLKDWTNMKPRGGTIDNQDCPICMCPVTAPTELTCGHIYCTQCLTHFVKSGLESTSFPLTCSADEARCGAPIAISILEKFLHPTKFQQLLETAFHAYMEQNPDVLGPCKTPGCTRLFARDPSGSGDGSKVAKCPSCFITACAACGKNAHQGVSCELAGRDLSEEYINNSRDIRRCPNCQTPIFKDGGCNHVSCRCGRHICWRCMHASATSDLCYNHMRERHGGIFDVDMDAAEARQGRAAQPGPAAFADIPVEYLLEDARARRIAEMQERIRERNRVEEALDRDHQLLAQRRLRIEQQIRADAVARRRREEEAARPRQNEGGGWCVVM